MKFAIIYSYKIIVRGVLMGNYKFSKSDTVEMAKKYGTPLYLMSEDIIRDRCREIRETFLNRYENTRAVYASKAFLTKEMARIIKSEGLGMDVVSGGEIYTALKVGFPMEKVIFHGNNKLEEEIDLAIKNGLGRIVIDNLEEVDLIDKIAGEYEETQKVLVRISPGVDSHTHKYIQTAQEDSKFGVPLREDIIKDLMERILQAKNIEFRGFHFHIGSQLLENDSHLKAIDIMFDLINRVRNEYKLTTYELNTGGGYGIKYTTEKPEALSYFTDEIMKRIGENAEKYQLLLPEIIIEPGRWIVGEAGMTIYKIGSIKEIPNIRTYVSVDGGMTDNIRPSLYQAKYDGIILNKYGEEKTEIVTIAGKCCESGDILIEDLKVPKLERGDYLGILSTGAYNYSMSSNYNKIPRPAVVIVKNGKDRLMVRRETYEDLLKNEI